MSRRCRKWKYVRSSTGRKVRRCAKYGGRSGTTSRRRKPANKGARCTRFKRVYSSVLHKKVRRCAKFGKKTSRARRAPRSQSTPVVMTVNGPVRIPTPPVFVPAPAPPPAWIALPAPPKLLLLPPNAQSLVNHERRMIRRLQSQMSKLRSSSQSATVSRWPQDRPRGWK